MVYPRTVEKVFRVARGLPPRELALDEVLRHDEAQELCWQAMDFGTEDDALALALKAFRISPMCAEAYNLFAAYLAQNDGERLLLYRWAIRVAELYLGKRLFEEDRGDFYSVLKTRPYMRARFQLALTLRRLGLYEEAISHLEEMLGLDTGDHLGARLILMTAYLEFGILDRARELIDKHRDDGGLYGSYSHLVWSWLKGVPADQFTRALKAALHSNEHIPTLLKNPETPVHFSGIGVSWSGMDGAAEYLEISYRLWDAHPKLKQQVIRKAAGLLPTIIAERSERVRRFRPPQAQDL